MTPEIPGSVASGAASGATSQETQGHPLTAVYREAVEHYPGGALLVLDRDLRYEIAGGRAMLELGLVPEHQIGRRPSDVFDADVAEQLEQVYQGALTGEPQAREVNIGNRTFLLRAVPVRDADGRVVRCVATGQDITELRRASERTQRLQRVTSELARALTPPEVLEVILREALPVLEASAGGAALISEDGARLEVLGHTGYEDALLQRFRSVPLDAPVPFAVAARTGEAYFLTGDEYYALFPQMLELRSGYRSGAGLPLTVGDRTLGVLVLSWTDDRAFDDSDRAFMLSVAGQCAQAIERANLYALVQRQKATLEEHVRERTRDLERERSFLSAVLSSLTEGIVACDEHGNLTLFNEAARHFHGLPVEPLRPEHWARRYHLYRTDGVTPLQQHEVPLHRALQGEHVRDAQMMIIPEGRPARRLLASGSPVLDASGRMVGAVVAMHDITDRTDAERQLRTAMNALDATKDGIFLFDADTLVFEYVNRGAIDQTGYSREELLTMTPLNIKPEFTDAEFRQMITPLMSGELPLHEFVTVHRRKDGTDVPVEIILQCVHIPGEDRQRFIALVRDITERREQELELHVAVQELRRSNADLEHFAYVASHDLQAPLRAVMSFTQLLAQHEQGRLDERGAMFMQHIQAGAHRMKVLIDDLLLFSRANRLGSHMATVHLDAVLQGAQLNLHEQLLDASTELTADPLPTITGNASALTQVLQNLLGNAIKYRNPKRPLRVHVSAQRDGTDWQISVRDNGIGIPEQYHDRIFLMFQRLHRSDEIEGTGVGLAVCKRIVERHGGRMWVESAPGEGSTFHFTLPGD